MNKPVFLYILLMLSPALADEAKSQVLDNKGVAGMWFPMESAKKVLADLKKVGEIASALELTEKRLDLEKQRVNLLERNVKTVELIATNWKTAAEGLSTQVREKDPWWKSPYLWITVGIIVGAGTTLGLSVAATRAK